MANKAYIYCAKITVSEEPDKIFAIDVKEIEIEKESDKAYVLPGKKLVSKLKLNTVVKTNEEAWALTKEEALRTLYDYYRAELQTVKEKEDSIKAKGRLVREALAPK